ncbi:monocarboxylate transporter 13-like, partial [Anneissia japonica]|uniref:monocarboxylate transporter 13-like n=1 Tax=Anneissia japonica TaxID=1529436 RepID=UPI00142586ED
LKVLLENYGWRGTLLVTGAIHLHGLVTATALDPSIGRKQDVTYTEIGKSGEDETFLQKIGERLQVRVFRDFKLIGLFTVSFSLAFTEVFFYLSLIPYAISISIEPMNASFLKTLVGMGCVVARIAQCATLQTVKTSARLFVLIQFLDVAALIIFITSNQYTVLAVTLFAHGATFGIQTCFVYFLTSKSVDAAYIGGAIGWSNAIYGLGHLSASLVGKTASSLRPF